MENELDQAEIHAPETNNMRAPKVARGNVRLSLCNCVILMNIIGPKAFQHYHLIS